MHIIHKGLILSCLPLLLVSATAVGGLNGVDVIIMNDSVEDVMVTVYDTSVQPNSVVLSRERINGFTRIPVSLAPDDTGHANVSWTAVSVDPVSPKCGHASYSGLIDAASVPVHADAECASKST